MRQLLLVSAVCIFSMLNIVYFRTDLMQYIMRCLESFVKSWDKITTSPKDLVAVQSQPVWEKIWAGTLR